jgi:Flp pilus assembly secretin CpaC
MKQFSVKHYKSFAVIIFSLLLSQVTLANEATSISVRRGFSVPLKLSSDASTVAIGDPNLIGVTTIKPNLLLVNGQETGSTSITIIAKNGVIYEYNVTVGNDVAQLKKLIGLVEKKVSVEDIDGTIVLRGEVPTAAALTRVLTIADRFASNDKEPDFKVISDKGGILAGNLDEKEEFLPPLQTVSSELQTLGIGGGRGGQGGGQGGRRAGGGNNRILSIMQSKGNLAQNLNRADIVTVADGKVLSLIKVKSQPKVEIQMRIVAVDRAKTDKLGIDWRLDGNKVTVGSKFGAVSSTSTQSPNQNFTSGFDAGESSLYGFFNPGSYFISAFLRAVEEKDAAKTLSEPLVTAVSGESSSFLVGGSIPIPVQEISPGNATSNAIVATRVEYIRFGLQLVVRPTVLENGKISIVLDQSISEPDYSNAIQIIGAAIPSFRTKYVTTITESTSGETWAVAGLLTEEDSKSLKSIPWLSKIPIIGWIFQNKDDTTSRNELMILVNARTIDSDNQTTTSFDGIGNLTPKQGKESIENTLKEEIDSDRPPKSNPTKNSQNADSANKNTSKQYAKQPTMLNNANTTFEKSSNRLIKPKPVPGRTYKEIVPLGNQMINQTIDAE